MSRMKDFALAPCPRCKGPMDVEALTFWAGEDPKDHDPQDMVCNPCYYEYALGTRTPTQGQIDHANETGW